MKYYTLLIVFILSFSACKNNTGSATETASKSQDQNLVTMQGEFIYHDGAAVLQTKHQIYGVVIDDMLNTLQKEVSPYKTSDLDMVTVTLKAKRIAKPEGEEGWPFRIEIKEILKIERPESGAQDVIELSK